jgi:hypothetical protein
MIERGEHFGLALKTREAIGIARERRGQDFERDLALQPRIACAIHLAHAACAQQAKDFVTAGSGSYREGHRGRFCHAPERPALKSLRTTSDR